MTRIGIAVPVWGRPRMRYAFLKHMKEHEAHAAQRGIGLRTYVAGSEGKETRSEAENLGHYYVEVDNDPLGRKFNLAVQMALDDGVDYVLIMGSDTFFMPSLWDQYRDLINAGIKYVGIRDLYMWDWNNDDARYWEGYKGDRFGEPIGCGRLIHRSLIKGDLYDNHRNKSLDASASRRLPKATVISCRQDLLVSCKEELSITPITSFPDAERVDHTMFIPLIP